jgi:hypothetical protein
MTGQAPALQQDPGAHSRRPRRRRRLCGHCLLLLYVAAAAPLAPGLAALLAATDTSHHVTIEQTTRGVRVVLRHQCAYPASHRHGVAARVLTLFAQRTTPAEPDHIIPFAVTDAAREASTINVDPESRSLILDDVSVAKAPPGCPTSNLVTAAFPRPPPMASGLMLAVRSTVLLV